VSFSETGIPAGINYTFLSSSSTSLILVVYVPTGAASGSYPVTITGVSGSLTATATMTLVIPQQSQTISFGAIPAQVVGTTLTVSAAATSGLPVTFTLVPNGNCSISGSAVTFLNVGNCGVIASQAGNASYTAAPAVGQIVVVNSAPPPPPPATATTGHSTVCQANGSASYCSDEAPGPADANGYHDLTWVNLNKSLASIAVSDNQVWGLDASGVLWFLPNFKSGTSWTMVASGVSQISAGHNLLCQINNNQHVYCSASPNPLLSQPDANGFQSISWFDTGATNLRQISVSTGTQFWAVDSSSNLVQIKDYRNLSATSTMVAAGVQQVAVDGRGVVCQVNSDHYVYCSNWSVPASSAQGGYSSLPWAKTTTQLVNIAVADGQVVGTDSNGDVWQLPDYTNSSTWYRIAYGGASERLSAASAPSRFVPANFATGEVAVLLFMGQSNSVGYNVLPSRFISPSSPNVWGVTNAGWNFLPGNTNGTTPLSGSIASINSVQWSNYALTATGPDMNLGFNNDAGPGGDAANFAAYQWQGLINAGWQLPRLDNARRQSLAARTYRDLGPLLCPRSVRTPDHMARAPEDSFKRQDTPCPWTPVEPVGGRGRQLQLCFDHGRAHQLQQPHERLLLRRWQPLSSPICETAVYRIREQCIEPDAERVRKSGVGRSDRLFRDRRVTNQQYHLQRRRIGRRRRIDTL
jgi:hypothetical protein